MYVKVKVITRAKKETIKKLSDNFYELTIKEPPERNLANQRIRELIAEQYGVGVKAVSLVSGHHSGSKILDVRID